MTVQRRSAVFDCNVYLQAILSTRGAAHACWRLAVTGNAILFVTPRILSEIRRLPGHKKLRRFATLTAERVERFVEELLDVARLMADPPVTFAYARDPEDARYVDAAIATGSSLIVSNDKDLLDLMNDANLEGKALRVAYPALRVLTPVQFLQAVRAGL